MKLIFYTLIIVCLAGCTTTGKNHPYADSYFAGVSNHGKTVDEAYLTAGDKAFIIGTQNGLFPDMGSHIRGEMGGIWTLPIKLADGFRLKLTDAETQKEDGLTKADTFINYPFGNRFVYPPTNGVLVDRMQFAPEGKKGVVVQYTFENTAETSRTLTLDFTLDTELIPVWFSKQNGIIDGKDTTEWDASANTFHAWDTDNNWHAVWGTDAPATNGNVEQASLVTTLQLKPGEKNRVTYVICGSTESPQEARTLLTDLITNKESLLAQKKDLYYALLKRSRIDIPDKHLEETYNWVKINTQWLVSDLDGIGRFLGAGAGEYPWLFGCDNSYALQGVTATGDFELAQSTLSLLKDVSEKVNGNGRIIHEMSSNGFVYNKGNTQETPHFILAVWKTFLWTGDMDFLRRQYPYILQGIQWLTEEMDKNRNLFPEGYGIMEVSGLNAELIDVAVYTQQALEVTAQMALLMDNRDLAEAYRAKAETLKEKINTCFWNEEESIYCDFYGSKEQAISVAQGALRQLSYRTDTVHLTEKIDFYNKLLEQIKQLPDSTEQGWFTNKNWVINTPMETGIAPREKAIRSLDKIRTEHSSEYGPYLSAVERNQAMTISTSVQAMSEASYGRTEEMLWYVNGIARTLHQTLPGSINEMLPTTLPGAIPSYMFLYGCPVQAWTIYGIATPIITHIFGVSPDAYHKQVVFEPHIPAGWDKLSLSDVRIGNNLFSIRITKEKDRTVYEITSKEDDWNYTLRLPDATDIPLTGKKNRVVF
ncbi:MAG: amylo-alpha-1,6-glucosidase [Tannerellaceae bacterium]|jgi:glycogen debranching enzyme|nr:amylo-alpha-1,6-glucosidase [Tannerellaceae bacterium]